VSLTPVGTEIVLALGQRERLLAVDAASAGMRGVGDLPVTESAAAGSFAPDVVLAPPREAAAVRRSAPAARIIEVEPHNFDDAWELCTSIGAALGREREAHRFVLETSRPLAELGRESFARRPRGGAGPRGPRGGGRPYFATDLIELAGGEREPRDRGVPPGVDERGLARAAPELSCRDLPRPSPRDLSSAGASGRGPRVEFLVFDRAPLAPRFAPRRAAEAGSPTSAFRNPRGYRRAR
jgi:ABC-type Fe3+-hydroxamate transport system substrate-binding protein